VGIDQRQKKGDFYKAEPEVDEFVNTIYQGKYEASLARRVRDF
jgi:hypothetical protein